jgi:hypothetical protein
MGITSRPLAAATWAAGLMMALSAQAAPPNSLVRPLAGAEVDWSAGTVTASAGSAADMRMPSADAARAGAERRARAAAIETLRTALRALVVRREERLVENEIEVALGHVSTARIEYQSNGGVVLWVQVRFEDFGAAGSTALPMGGSGTENRPAGASPVSRVSVPSTTSAPAPTLVLAVGAMELQVRPLVVAGGKEVVARAVRYRQGQAPRDAISARRDDKGRLVLPKGNEQTLEQLAAGSVVIYLQKVVP